MRLERIDLEGLAVVTSYGDGGFRVAGKRYEGSLILRGETLHIWPVSDPAEIEAESLSVIIDSDDPPDLLLIGTGRAQFPLSPDVKTALADRGVMVETMTTGAAVRTYSFLTMEGRRVAGALIAV